MADTRPTQGRGERRRAFAVRLLARGLLLVPLSLVIAGIAGNTTGIFAFVAPAVVGLIVAAIVRFTGRFLVPALVMSVLLFLFCLLLSENEIVHPESFADFVPAVVRLVGLAAAVFGAIAGIRQRRRGTLRPATQRERRGVRIGVVALVAIAAVSFVLTQNSQTSIARPDGAIVVDTSGDSFDPDELRVEPGRVRILVRNDDSYAHTFSIDDLQVDEYIGPRSDRLISFAAKERRRSYPLYCAINGHEEMEGSVVVG